MSDLERDPRTFGARKFPTTRWSLVLNLKTGSLDVAEEALGSLCADYRSPLIGYICAWGYSSADAEDLVQSFLVNCIESEKFNIADRSKGRLRSYLLATLKNFLLNHRRHASARKRGGDVEIVALEGAADGGEIGSASGIPSDAAFDRDWAAAIMGRVMENLASAYAFKNRSEIFRTVIPWLARSKSETDYSGAAEDLGVSRQRIAFEVHRLRRHFAEAVREEISHTVDCHTTVEDELRYFLSIVPEQ